MKAKIKWEGRVNLDVLLENLKSISKIEPNGKVSYDAFRYIELEWTILSLIDFGTDISFESKKQILTETFNIVTRKAKFEKDFFIEQLQSRIDIHHAKRRVTFCLLDSLSISRLPFRKLRIGECTIHVHGAKFPKRYVDSRNKLIKTKYFSPDESTYTKVSVEVISGDHRDAYEKAFYHLEIFRSFLCLVLNAQFEMRFGERTLKPINKIRQGSVATLHLETGELANENYYAYIQDYKKAESLMLSDKLNKELRKSISWLVSKLNKCSQKHSEGLSEALVNYASAFDESNKYICFLRSWTVLEILTKTDQNDILIKRCSSLINPSSIALQKQRLESLRSYRNEYVHEGDNGLDPMVACFRTQNLIYNLIIKFNLRYAGFFENLEEANSFLDNHSVDLQQLKIRKKILDKVIKKKSNS